MHHDGIMRTTVTLDPDVEAMLRKEVRQRGESFKEVLNNAIRLGLRNMKRRGEAFEPLTFEPLTLPSPHRGEGEGRGEVADEAADVAQVLVALRVRRETGAAKAPAATASAAALR